MSIEATARRLAPALALLLSLARPALADEQLHLRIAGIGAELRNNARAALSLEHRRQLPGLTADTIRELHAEATAEIARALEPFGYYRPEIEATLTAPTQPGGAWQAKYLVDPGPPVAVDEARVEFSGPGARDPKLAALGDAFGLRPGEVLDHRRYEAAKRELLLQVQEQGYRYAALQEPRVEVDLATYAARIELRIATGPRFVIGTIGFEQNRFDPAWLQRYLVLQPGEPYTSSALARQRQVLSQSGYFRQVEIVTLPATKGKAPAVPLQIRLETYQPNRYRGRVGWGTDTGFGVGLDWTRRYVGGRGQRFNLGVAAVEERNRLAGNLSYTIPLQPLDGDYLEFVARHESKDLTYDDVGLDEGGETRIATNLLSGFWHRPLGTFGSFDLEMVPGVSLVTENYDVFEVLFGDKSGEDKKILIDIIGRDAYNTLTPDFEAVVPSLTLTARRADERLFIRDGDMFRAELLGAHESLGSNITFWQAKLDTWHIRPLFDSDRVLLRTGFGYSDAESREVLGATFNQMPEYYEFRAGGVRGIRGYGWEELFPKNAITGGKHIIEASLEYEHQIIPDWSVAVFLDGGNTFNEFDEIEPKYGTGIGARWRSPVGLVRLDLGIPLDKADDSFQVYITVGPEF